MSASIGLSSDQHKIMLSDLLLDMDFFDFIEVLRDELLPEQTQVLVVKLKEKCEQNQSEAGE